jgi:hypothetical protein
MINMTRYVKLYNNAPVEERVNINVVFGHEVGAWVEGRNPTNLKIGRELILGIQRKCRHNRRKMNNPYKWRDLIKDISEKYVLRVEEKVVV